MSGDNRALSLAVGPFCLLKLSEDKKVTTLCILAKFFCPCSLIGSSYLISNIQTNSKKLTKSLFRDNLGYKARQLFRLSKEPKFYMFSDN